MIPINIPQLADKELYEVIRKIALLAATLNDLIVSGDTFPTQGKRKFFWDTNTKQLYFYTGDATVGTSGWIVLG